MRAFTTASTRVSLVRRDRARLADVEAQPVRRVEAALLRDVRAEFAAQRLVQQMRRRVVRADRAAPVVIDRGDHGGVHAGRSGLDAAEVDEQIAQLLLRVGDADRRCRRRR